MNKSKFDLLFEDIMSNISQTSIFDKLKLITPDFTFTDNGVYLEQDNVIMHISADKEYGENMYRIGVYNKEYSKGISELIEDDISLEQLKEMIESLLNSFFKKYNNEEINVDILKLKEKLTLI